MSAKVMIVPVKYMGLDLCVFSELIPDLPCANARLRLMTGPLYKGNIWSECIELESIWSFTPYWL